MAGKKIKKVSKEVAIQLQEMNSEHLLEYGIDLQNRTYQLIGDIDEDKFAEVDAALSTLEAHGAGSIRIKVCSYGGSTHHALAIISRIRSSPCEIITEGFGAIMSAATLILACGNRRQMSEYGIVMHHEASYEVSGPHSVIAALVRQTDREEKMWAQIMEKFTKKDANFWLNSGKGGIDFYLDAKQCLEYGIVDEVF